MTDTNKKYCEKELAKKSHSPHVSARYLFDVALC